MRTAGAVTIAVISHNGKKVIESCLDSIFKQKYPKFNVLFIDIASTDGTPEWVKENYPSVEIETYPYNHGPNPGRNLGIKKSKSELVLLVDDDAVLHEDCLKELVKASEIHSDGAIWVPKILYADNKSVLQMDLIFLHFIQEAIIPNTNKLEHKGISRTTETGAAAGITLLVSKKAALEVGGFDEDFFFGRDDGEFSFRVMIAGKKIYCVSEAKCYHRVKERGLSKVRFQLRNRWYVIISMYQWKTIIVLIPAFIIYEILLVSFMLSKGMLFEYFSAMREVVENFQNLMKKRNSINSYRKISDDQILHCGTINMRSDISKNRFTLIFKSLLDNFFCLYWKAFRALL